MKTRPVPDRTMGKAKLSTLIDYYLGDMRRRGCTDDSVTTNARALRRFAAFVGQDLDDARLSEIGPERAGDYVSDLQRRKVRWKDHPNRNPVPGKLSVYTIRKEVRILKGFGTWLEREGFENPFSRLVLPKEPKHLVRVLSDDEIDLILRSINPRSPIGSRAYAIVLFMLDSGPRLSEVIRARLPDLDLETRQIRVIGKGNKERILPFGSRTGKAFLNYIHLHRPAPMLRDYDQLFLSMDGIPMTRGSLSSVLGRLKKASGVERLHAHLFRHTFAVKYLMNGGDLITLQRILGHESLEVTKRYLSLTHAQVNLRYESFSPVDHLQVGGLRRFGNKRSLATSP